MNFFTRLCLRLQQELAVLILRRVRYWHGRNMAEQLTDQALVERVQQGDKKAFNLLVSRYQNKVAGLLTRYVSRNDIPDVVQESFIKAYRSIESFRGESAFYTWLYRIAVNTAKII